MLLVALLIKNFQHERTFIFFLLPSISKMSLAKCPLLLSTAGMSIAICFYSSTAGMSTEKCPLLLFTAQMSTAPMFLL